TEASLVCESWPFCSNGSPFDFASYNFFQWVQMSHRLIAGVLFIWTILFFVKIIKNYKGSSIIYWGWMITLGLVSAQVVLGALVGLNGAAYGLEANVAFFDALFHALFITCYFGMLSFFILLSSRSAKLKK